MNRNKVMLWIRRIAAGLFVCSALTGAWRIKLTFFAPLPAFFSPPPNSHIQISRRPLGTYTSDVFHGTEYFLRGESIDSMAQTASWFDDHYRSLRRPHSVEIAIFPKPGFKPIDSKAIKTRTEAVNDMEWARLPAMPIGQGIYGIYSFGSSIYIYIWPKGDGCIFEVFSLPHPHDD